VAEVGIRAFKAELSRYLREVRSGKAVSVTDRGQVIAEVISPVAPPRRRGFRQPSDLRLRALIEAGVLRPALSADRPWAKGRLVHAAAGTARRLLDADRAE
jgi:prevent-host-death family protein